MIYFAVTEMSFRRWSTKSILHNLIPVLVDVLGANVQDPIEPLLKNRTIKCRFSCGPINLLLRPCSGYQVSNSTRKFYLFKYHKNGILFMDASRQLYYQDTLKPTFGIGFKPTTSSTQQIAARSASKSV